MCKSQSLRWSLLLLPLSLSIVPAGKAQQPATQPPASGGRAQPTPEMLERQKLSIEDRQKMLDLLHIATLRPPVEARSLDVPHPANYDESKANPYPKPPDPLVLKNGKK